MRERKSARDRSPSRSDGEYRRSSSVRRDRRGYPPQPSQTGTARAGAGSGSKWRRNNRGDYGPRLARELDSSYDEKIHRNYATSIFVGNLPYDCTPEDLKEFFASLGGVVRADIITSKGHHRGMGTVEFTTEDRVAKAIEQFDGAQFLDRQIFVRRDQPPPDSVRPTIAPSRARQGGFEVAVRNLPQSVDWQVLKSMFKDFGEVLRADIELDRAGMATGRGKVVLPTRDQVERAIQHYHGLEVDGNVLELERTTLGRSQRPTRNVNGLPSGPASPATVPEMPGQGGPRSTLVHCANLPKATTSSDLHDLFGTIGVVVRAELNRDDHDCSTRVAIVEYRYQRDADECVATLQGYRYGDCELQVSYASPWRNSDYWSWYEDT